MITIRWTDVGNENDPLWCAASVLYAYLSPSGREILYIGQACGCTVRERWRRSGKAGFWNALERDRGIRSHCVIVGVPELPAGMRLTKELLSDVESLLIARLQPWGNIQCLGTRICRPGMVVQCRGNWPGPQRKFVDA